jgi:hypothetical protein
MKAVRALLIPAIAAAGVALATDAVAQTHSGRHSAGAPTGSHHWSGTHRWSGTGGHWRGGYHGGYRHSHFGFYFGVPLFWPAYAWGYPYYYYDYPRTVIYREVPVYPEGEMSSTEVQPAPGAPQQGPLYMNYCESAKAYYPKVASCPEGWKFVAPTR